MSKGLVIVLSGPAGSGKDTVLESYFEAGGKAGKTVSATTRRPRKGERDGVDYTFLTRDRFEADIAAGKLLEYTEYSGNYYGTPVAEVERLTSEGCDVILKIEVEGGRNVRRLYPDAVLVFLLPPSAEELARRLRGRGTEDEATVRVRLQTAAREIDEARGLYDYILVNDSVKKAAHGLAEIIAAEHLKMSRCGGFFKEFNEVTV